MTEYNTAEIYDNPAGQMTTSEVFQYLHINRIPFRGRTGLSGWGA